jgi:hypothetical protein
LAQARQARLGRSQLQFKLLVQQEVTVQWVIAVNTNTTMNMV